MLSSLSRRPADGVPKLFAMPLPQTSAATLVTHNLQRWSRHNLHVGQATSSSLRRYPSSQCATATALPALLHYVLQGKPACRLGKLKLLVAVTGDPPAAHARPAQASPEPG